MKNKKLSDTETLTSKASKSVTSNYFFRKRSRDRAFQNLIDVVPSNKNTIQKFEFYPNESDESLLLKTCNLIGKIEKIKFIQGFKNSSQSWSPLKKILRASNIRSRKIYLNINWWKSDHGHLLAFLKDEKTPVALIRKNKKYILINIRTGTEVSVNKEISENISNEAHSFFSPLPDGKISQLALLKFILAFTKKDVIFFFILGVFGAVLSLFIPIMSGYIFSVIVPGGLRGSLFEIIGILLTIVTLL